MKKVQKQGKLRLSRDTLRALAPETLEQVGGATWTTISATLQSLRCPTSFYPRCPSDYAV